MGATQTVTVMVPAAGHDVSWGGNVRSRWYRMVWDDSEGKWTYFSDEKEPPLTVRRWTTYGRLPIGAIICEHEYGGPTNSVGIVEEPDEEGRMVAGLEFYRASGKLIVTMPDGSRREFPDPRKRK